MGELLQALFSPQGLLFLPLICGIAGCLTFGVMGAYVNARGISYIASAIAHSLFLGAGISQYCRHELGWEWCTLLSTCTTTAVCSALVIGWATLKVPEKADSVISTVMVSTMSLGLILLQQVSDFFDPSSILFGDILLVESKDLYFIMSLNAIVFFLGILFYNKLVAICFDEEFARLRGIKTDFYYLLLLTLIALAIVVMIQMIGIILVIALLTLPSLTASLYARKLWQTMLVGTLLAITSVIGGMASSFQFELPTGPMITIIAVAFYLSALTFRFLKRS